MKKLKLMTIIGTRPEIIRLSEVIKKCDRYFDHILVHTGQNYDYSLNRVFFDELGLRAPDHDLKCAGKDLGESMGNIISRSYDIMTTEKPQALLILGDTNSSLSAISAKRLKVPIFHMEAGNRCWDWNVSEMINRKIVDHIADINMPYAEHSRRYLISEGIDGKTVFTTGSPMREVLNANADKIAKSGIIDALELQKENYLLLSAHREENIDINDNFFCLMNAVNNIADQTGMPIVYSMHPRSRKIIAERGFEFHPLVKCHEPFGFHDYVNLQQNAYCVISDSGTLSEESAILGFPAVLLRTSTERPEALENGNVVIGGITTDTIRQAIELSISMKSNGEAVLCDESYMKENVSDTVIRIIQSYTDIVRRTVWQIT